MLAGAAEGFLDEWLGERAHAFRPGPDGLVALCKELERWAYREQVSEAAEHRFVEGAGALLSLLLLDHVRDGGHAARASVHRVRLGQFGFFDPFAAIDRALDAPDIRAELCRQVALAEAEAQGRGPLARVAKAFVETVARARPDLTFEAQFDCLLWLRDARGEPIEVDLQRAVDSTRDQDEQAVARVVERLIAMLPGSATPAVPFSELRTRIVPRLARGDVLRELSAEGKPALFEQPLTDELAVALLVEYEGRARYVQEREFSAWGIAPAEALELALENLAARSASSRVLATDTAFGPLLVGRTGDGRDSARVLLKPLYRALAQRLGERVYVGVPHRDTFFACHDDPKLVRELARRTAHDAERAPHPLSARVFELSAGGLREWRTGEL